MFILESKKILNQWTKFPSLETRQRGEIKPKLN